MAYSNFYARFYAWVDVIKASFRTIFQHRTSYFYLAFILVWQMIVWFQAWFINRYLSGDILVMHYNVDFGIDLVDSPTRIYLYPFAALLVLVFNLIILASFYKSHHFRILVHFLLGAAALFALFLSIALIAVYLINFR